MHVGHPEAALPGRTVEQSIALYVRAGWPWETVATFFGVSKKSVRRVVTKCK